jgi:hypothetical protein
VYYTLALASLVGAHFSRQRLRLPIAGAAWASLFLAAAVSGSRSFVVALAPVLMATLLAFVLRPQLFGTVVRTAALAAFVISLVGATTVVQEGIEVFGARLDNTAGSGGLFGRLQGSVVISLSAWSSAPWLGVGLGAGTNAGTALAGGAFFRYGEGEWTRIVFEAGPVLGLAYIGWRLWILGRLLRSSWQAANRGYVLPLLFVAACATSFVVGQWGQTSIQGLGIWTAGMSVAACRLASEDIARRWAAPRLSAVRMAS